MKVKKVEDRPVPPCVSISNVTVHSPIDEDQSKSRSMWNPDWTIQKEVSITIEYSTSFVHFKQFFFSLFQVKVPMNQLESVEENLEFVLQLSL